MGSTTNPIEVIEHSSKRKNKNPSLALFGIKNPRKALEKAHIYLDLINKLIDSKKGDENKLSSFDFITDRQIKNGISNFLVRIRNRKGQVDFSAITEDGRFIDTEFLWHYKSKEFIFHNYCLGHLDQRYYLHSLVSDLKKINTDIKLVYIVFTFATFEKAYIFTLDQLIDIEIRGESSIPNFVEFKDEVDKYYERMSKVKNPCPDCGQEWNNNFCQHCGHPH